MIIKAVEGCDRSAKLNMFRQKMELKKQDMEEKHIKIIIRTLKEFADSIRLIISNLETKVKGLLDYALNEFIS